MTIEEKPQKYFVEKEAQKSQASTSSMTTKQKHDRRKVLIEYASQPQPSSTLQDLLRSVEIKKSLERMSSEVDAQEATFVPQPKRQRIEYPSPQTDPPTSKVGMH